MGGAAPPGVTEVTGGTLGCGTEAPGDATTAVGPTPMSPGSDDIITVTRGDVTMEVTAPPGVTEVPRDTLGDVAGPYGDATTMVGPIPTSPGGDRVMVATRGDVIMEVTAPPGVTKDPRDTLGDVTEAYGDATTMVGPMATSPGGDSVMMATHGDVTMGVMAPPGVTEVPGDTSDDVTEPYGDATTVVGPIPTTSGGDKVTAATCGDVAMEVTAPPGVTEVPGDTLDCDTEAPGDATTMVGPVPTSPGGDRVMVATRGDVIVGVTAPLGVTEDPRDTLGDVTEAYRDATTVVGPMAMSLRSDDIMVATRGDVLVEVTAPPSVTEVPGDTLDCDTEAPGDATTMVGPVPTSPGGDRVTVATHGDVAMEAMAPRGVTEVPGDTTDDVTEACGDATTTVGRVTVPQGADRVMVATRGDVAMEGTEEPEATDRPGDISGHVPEAYGDATTVVGPVGGDEAAVARGRDVVMEVTAPPGVTNCSGAASGRLPEAYGDATTMVGPVATSPGGDKVMVATNGDILVEVTAPPRVTEDPRDTLGDVTEAYGDATTMVGPIPTSPGGDRVVAATRGDVLMEVTAPPGITKVPGDTSDHVTEAYGDATTMVGPVPTSPGSDDVITATRGDAAVEAMAQPGVTEHPRDTLGDVAEPRGDATTVVGPVTAPQGGDRVTAATRGDVIMGGTTPPGVTEDPGDTLGDVTKAPGDATTMVGPVPTSPGGGRVVAAAHGAVATEGTAPPGVTEVPRDALGDTSEAPGDATTMVGPVPTSPGGDDISAAPRGDVTMGVLAPPGVTAAPGATSDHVPEAPGDATTAAGPAPPPPGSDDITAAPRSDVTMGGAAPPGAFPVALTPPPGRSQCPASSAPSARPRPLLLLLPLPLLLLLR